jgi:membrane protein implicated in regulation of membrane protease activity
VRLGGEIWEARCESGASPGDRVRVTGRDGLTLVVEATA